MEPDGIEIYELETERNSQAPDEVRHWLHSLPAEWPADLDLLTHELVVNAVTHTNTSHLWLTLLVCPDVIHVQVANEGAKRPQIVEHPPYAESGRGLRWVDSLSETWGVGCTSATHVWFQVPRMPSSEAAPAAAIGGTP